MRPETAAGQRRRAKSVCMCADVAPSRKHVGYFFIFFFLFGAFNRSFFFFLWLPDA